MGRVAARPAKRPRTGTSKRRKSVGNSKAAGDCLLLSLPAEVLENVLRGLDSVSLANTSQCCLALNSRDAESGLRLTQRIARDKLLHVCGPQLAGRWRRMVWLERLYVEEALVGFDLERCYKHGFRFCSHPDNPDVKQIRLDGMGPKLLVSDLSTMDQPVLRWRMTVRGNTAVEFGVVPVGLQDTHKALHKCYNNADKLDERPVGFCSSITVGSQLPLKFPVMKGSVVEVMAQRGRVEFLVQNPLDGQELYWQNTRTVPKPYKGPREMRFEQECNPNCHIKLALTCWAYGAFDAPTLTARPSAMQPRTPQPDHVDKAVQVHRTKAARHNELVTGWSAESGMPPMHPSSPQSDASTDTQ